MYRNKFSSILVASMISIVSLSAHAMDHGHEMSHGHRVAPPIGVMGDHVMNEGEWMLSYRLMHMEMEGNRIGTDRIAVPLAGYMMSPLAMSMDMHMLGGMYGLDEDVTMMLMLPFVSKEMSGMMNMSSMRFDTESSGVGDIRLTATIKTGRQGTLLNAGLSIPTGSIDERGVTPMSSPDAMQLPYPMQLGSGTYDITLGATHVERSHALTWGLQAAYTFRSGDNDNGYNLGDALELNGWMSKAFGNGISGSFRLNARDWSDVDGADPALAMVAGMMPAADPDLRAGTRVLAIIGMNIMFGSYRIGIEYSRPVHQDLDGPQLGTDDAIMIGLVSMF